MSLLEREEASLIMLAPAGGWQRQVVLDLEAREQPERRG